MNSSVFLFTTCQIGAEGALKKEIAREHPELRFAYSRPGFITFKSVDPQMPIHPKYELRSVFARAYGMSLGKVKGPERIQELLTLARQFARKPLKLHVWERDRFPKGEEPLGYVDHLLSQAALEEILEADQEGLFDSNCVPDKEDLVLDVIVLDAPTETGDLGEWWVGCHIHSPSHAVDPGAKPRIALPEASPSRAYLKLEEAIHWSGALVRPGDVAVEIGSAPGGASFALLERGLEVIGIDPGEMAPNVLNHPRFTHIQRPVATVLREELPQQVDWLLLDMNVEPRISIYAVDRLVSRMSSCLLGVFLTIKLNQWAFAEQIPDWMAHVKAMGMSKVRATQLASNRQEILIYGITHQGLKRSPIIRSRPGVHQNK